jgi:hypothetical protein
MMFAGMLRYRLSSETYAQLAHYGTFLFQDRQSPMLTTQNSAFSYQTHFSKLKTSGGTV